MILARTKNFEVHRLDEYSAEWVCTPNGKRGREFYIEVDGFWVWQPAASGALDSWMMRQLADCLDQLNEGPQNTVVALFEGSNEAIDRTTYQGAGQTV